MYYLDVHLNPSYHPKGIIIPIPPEVLWVRGVMKEVHGLLRNQPNKLAVAFPDYKSGSFRRLGRKIRIFGSDKQDVDFFKNLIENSALSDQCLLSNVKDVPFSFKGSWSCFVRVRPPRRQSCSHQEFALRVDEIKTFPNISLKSQSTNQTFFLNIKKISQKEVPDTTKIKTNTYGLSSKNHLTFLPNLP